VEVNFSSFAGQENVECGEGGQQNTSHKDSRISDRRPQNNGLKDNRILTRKMTEYWKGGQKNIDSTAEYWTGALHNAIGER
jgi:hypothetical protein